MWHQLQRLLQTCLRKCPRDCMTPAGCCPSYPSCLQGRLCGDCLFARYGENIEEAVTNKGEHPLWSLLLTPCILLIFFDPWCAVACVWCMPWELRPLVWHQVRCSTGY